MRLRPVRDGDAAFLADLVADARPDLALLPDAVRGQVVALQRAAQEAGWRAAARAPDFAVVEVDGEPVGRLYLDRRGDELRVVDIAVHTRFRGAGLGAALLRRVQAEAAASGIPVRLHVARDNPAQRLYARLGFTVEGSDAVRLGLIWRAGSEPVDDGHVAAARGVGGPEDLRGSEARP